MKNYLILFFSLILLFTCSGFGQAVHQSYSPKFDTVGYIPPSIPGGFDALYTKIEKEITSNDSNLISSNEIYDAVITFTINEIGVITKYNYKGSNISGIDYVVKKCIVGAPWIPGKSSNDNKIVESTVQMNFTYKIQGNKFMYVKKNPVYIYNYNKTKRNKKSASFAIGTVFVAVFFGGLFYLLVD